MKKFYSQLSLILALILVINLCNIGYVIEVKAEAEAEEAVCEAAKETGACARSAIREEEAAADELAADAEAAVEETEEEIAKKATETTSEE